MSKIFRVFLSILGLLVLIFVAFIVYIYFFDPERHDWKAIGYLTTIGQKMFDFKQVNQKYPESLGEMNVDPKYCVIWDCYMVIYTTDTYRQHFSLVTKSPNYPWILYFHSVEGNRNCCFGMAFAEDYHLERTDYPIYRKSEPFTQRLELWPTL